MIIKYSDHWLWQTAIWLAKQHGWMGDMIICSEYVVVRGKLGAALRALGY